MPTSQSLAYKWKIWLLQPIQFHKYTYWHGLHAPHESLRHRPWSCLLNTFWFFSYLICWFTYPFCSSNEYSIFFKMPLQFSLLHLWSTRLQVASPFILCSITAHHSFEKSVARKTVMLMVKVACRFPLKSIDPVKKLPHVSGELGPTFKLVRGSIGSQLVTYVFSNPSP